MQFKLCLNLINNMSIANTNEKKMHSRYRYVFQVCHEQGALVTINRDTF